MSGVAAAFITDFGVVRMGPKFRGLMDQLVAPGMQAGRRTKKYQNAKRNLARIEAAVSVLAEAEWAAGDVLTRTP